MVTGNTSSISFPLPVVAFPDSLVVFNEPIYFQEGNNSWNGAHNLTFTVESMGTFLNPGVATPAVFSKLTLLFRYDDTLYPVAQESGQILPLPTGQSRSGSSFQNLNEGMRNTFYNRFDDHSPSSGGLFGGGSRDYPY